MRGRRRGERQALCQHHSYSISSFSSPCGLFRAVIDTEIPLNLMKIERRFAEIFPFIDFNIYICIWVDSEGYHAYLKIIF